jgi:hypothetical protein
MHEAEFVAEHLSSEFYKFDDKSHFFSKNDMKEVLETILTKVAELLQ